MQYQHLVASVTGTYLILWLPPPPCRTLSIDSADISADTGVRKQAGCDQVLRPGGTVGRGEIWVSSWRVEKGSAVQRMRITRHSNQRSGSSSLLDRECVMASWCPEMEWLACGHIHEVGCIKKNITRSFGTENWARGHRDHRMESYPCSLRGKWTGHILLSYLNKKDIKNLQKSEHMNSLISRQNKLTLNSSVIYYSWGLIPLAPIYALIYSTYGFTKVITTMVDITKTCITHNTLLIHKIKQAPMCIPSGQVKHKSFLGIIKFTEWWQSLIRRESQKDKVEMTTGWISRWVDHIMRNV